MGLSGTDYRFVPDVFSFIYSFPSDAAGPPTDRPRQ
jgi:hypothetical protein